MICSDGIFKDRLEIVHPNVKTFIRWKIKCIGLG